MNKWVRWAVALGGAAVVLLTIAGRGGQAAVASGDRVAQAEALRQIGARNFFLGVVWDWSVLLLLLQTRAAATLHQQIAARVRQRWMADLIFFAILVAAVDLVGWPFRYVSSYEIGRRFGLNIQTPSAWLGDQVLSLGLNVALSAPALVVLYWLIRRAPRHWWMPASVLGLGAIVLLTLLTPVVIAPLFNRYEPVTDAEILKRVARLGQATDVPIGAVLQVDMGRRTTAANAWVAGLWGTRQIVLGDTLLNRYTPDQIEAVLAHELGHVVHNDVLWGTLVLAGAQAAALFGLAHGGNAILQRFGAKWGVHQLHQPASAPLLLLLVSFLGLLGSPILNAGSRWRERSADRYALSIASNPAALAEVFEVLSDQNLSDPTPPAWHVWLFMSHPPISERIEMVRRLTTPTPE